MRNIFRHIPTNCSSFRQMFWHWIQKKNLIFVLFYHRSARSCRKCSKICFSIDVIDLLRVFLKSNTSARQQHARYTKSNESFHLSMKLKSSCLFINIFPIQIQIFRIICWATQMVMGAWSKNNTKNFLAIQYSDTIGFRSLSNYTWQHVKLKIDHST